MGSNRMNVGHDGGSRALLFNAALRGIELRGGFERLLIPFDRRQAVQNRRTLPVDIIDGLEEIGSWRELRARNEQFLLPTRRPRCSPGPKDAA